MRRVQAGIDFLRDRARRTEPFVLYLPLSMPHPPYACPQPFHDMVNPADIPPLRPANLPGKPDYFDLIRRYRRLDEVPDEVFAKIQAVYLGSNSYVDWMLGQLLDALDETGLAENTCVVVTSDHGDWAGDNGLVEKWPSALDDTLTRVPLLIRAPGGAGDTFANRWNSSTHGDGARLGGCRSTAHALCAVACSARGVPGDLTAPFAEGGYDPHEPHAFSAAPTPTFSATQRTSTTPRASSSRSILSVCRAVMMRTLTTNPCARSA